MFLVDYLFNKKNAKLPVWIGLTRSLHNSSDWHWSNNKEMNYLNWGFKELERDESGQTFLVITMIFSKKKNSERWIP
ncbi:hypothetical protein B4U80_14399 [Leptotrombidium deliense]|uniref:C-type lectin domain-containing protein n=1 Tax=Leptotrombidium deliense TaxID=299467 RepID=A0A443RW58_9ACAR|nr:hypothetical protein B4U80_14399 [Leptotrombidium deliense]